MTEAKDLIKKYLSSWGSKAIDFPEINNARDIKGVNRQLIDKPLTQATVMLGHMGIARNNPDYYACYVMNYILGGGGFSSRLLTNIRDEQGLAYSVSSYFMANRQPGSFQIIAQTKNESAKQVVKSVLAEMKKIIYKPITDEELQAAKAFITGNFPLKLDTNSKIVSYLTYMENHNLGMDYLEKFPKYINTVTKEKIHQAAIKYLHPDDYVLVIVGNQAEIGL